MGVRTEIIDPWAELEAPPRRKKYRPQTGLAKVFARALFAYRPEHAAYILIAAAAHVDEQYTSDERQEVVALTHRMKSMRDVPQSRKDKFIRATFEGFKAGKLEKMVEKACWSLPRARADSIFMHVCDIVLADRYRAPVEKKFVKQVAALLGLKPERAVELAEFIGIKNQH